MTPRGVGGLAPRMPRPAAMLLCALAVLLAALTLAAPGSPWSLVGALSLQVPAAGAASMLLTATGLLLLLFRRRAAGLLFGLAGAVAALICGWEAAAQPGLTVIDPIVAESARAVAVSLFIAALATALVAWPEPGAARWAGVELTTGFLIAAGAVGLVSGYDGAGSSLAIVAGLPAPVAIGLVLLGLALQGLIFDPVGQRRTRLRPVMFATLTIALGIWLAIALAYAKPHTELHTLVLAAVLVAGPMGAWLIARGLGRLPAVGQDVDLASDSDDEFWVPPRAMLSSDSAPGAVDAVAQMTVAGVAMVNAEGRLTVFNNALAGMYGFDDPPYMGHASADALRLYDADKQPIPWPESPLGRAMHGEDSTDVDLTFRPVGKPKVEALVSARAFEDAAGRFAGAVMLVRDVTAQRQRERAFDAQVQLLEQSSEELKRITDVSAHHLQEPVRGITSYAQLLQRKLRDDDESAEYLGFLMQESQRIKSLVTDLLRYLELEADKVHPEMLDLAQALDGVRGEVAARHPAVELAVLHGELPHVYADPAMLGVLLDAVLDNTAQFGAKNMPALTVSAERNSASHCIDVLFTDNGPGIGNEHLERAFELFAQLQNIGETQGNGVGLAMVRKIARVHGGDAVLEPNAMGGIRLLVSLPLPKPDTN